MYTYIYLYTADVDYIGRTNDLLTFDSSNTVVTVNVSIIVTNDSIPEDDEQFTVSLSFPGEPIPRVTLDPDNATVTILEFDGEGMNLIIHLENCLIILLVSN